MFIALCLSAVATVTVYAGAQAHQHGHSGFKKNTMQCAKNEQIFISIATLFDNNNRVINNLIWIVYGMFDFHVIFVATLLLLLACLFTLERFKLREG